VSGRKQLPASQWQPAFPGQRPPFTVGNRAAVKDGAYARLQLSEKAAETAEELRGLLPVVEEYDEPALQAFAYVLEQLKAAAGALENARDRETRLRLSQDARGWALAGLRYAEHFGATPRARAALGLDLLRGQQAQLTARRLARMVEEEGAGGEAA
jgi:hypothetical protein